MDYAHPLLDPAAVARKRHAEINGSGLLRNATPRRIWTGFEKTARRIVLAAGALGDGGAIEVVEAGRSHRLGTGDPVARVEVHDPRAYEALLRSGSVGLGASYVAGWWDVDDLTAFLRELFSSHAAPARPDGPSRASCRGGARRSGAAGRAESR